MRIGELSRVAGVPVPTIKYYLREGLLPPGEFTSPNQARYDERHVRRLRLVRALLDIGRLPIATIRELLADLDRSDPDVHHLLGRALMSTAAPRGSGDDEESADAVRQTDELIGRRGWRVSESAPARRAVAEVIAALRRLRVDDVVEMVDRYAEAAERIADVDLEVVRRRAEPDEMLYAAVAGTVLGDALIAGLRRLAQENASAKLFRAAPTDDC